MRISTASDSGTAGVSATSTPRNSATSPGSPNNEPGINGPGKAGQAYNAAGAPSNYDTACANVTAHGTGTPMQTSSSPTQITNNSIATRDANLVNTGTGATK